MPNLIRGAAIAWKCVYLDMCEEEKTSTYEFASGLRFQTEGNWPETRFAANIHCSIYGVRIFTRRVKQERERERERLEAFMCVHNVEAIQIGC